ncbi:MULTISPECIES: hypothetical protein [Pseudomonas]|uniref:hypothetical protein n=1 Tax=Pseudomonas TaxID=286 RepID=UPI0015E39F2D|nr:MULTISPECIES: hypothetical protein [Pseudomonas]MBA1302745.1 hypothetical protein [Pseudomonas carnis]MBJ2202959.1 hypothetical protein [Pseudomonas carnis]MBW9243980.1 hypothetical protein [Pseudomonas paracarnis]ULN82678.1 hypothetical protein HXW87_10990 [Pseudomonas sp. Y5-11]
MKNRRSRINHEKILSEKMIPPTETKEEELSVIGFFAEVIAIIIFSWCAYYIYSKLQSTNDTPEIFVNKAKSLVSQKMNEIHSHKYTAIPYSDFIKIIQCNVSNITCVNNDYRKPETKIEREARFRNYTQSEDIQKYSERYIKLHDCKSANNTCTAIEVAKEMLERTQIANSWSDENQYKGQIVDCTYRTNLEFKSYREYINSELYLDSRRSPIERLSENISHEQIEKDLNTLEAKKIVQSCNVLDYLDTIQNRPIIKKGEI